MTIQQAIRNRHSVRSYENKPIPADILCELKREIEACNKESGLHLQLIANEPKAFSCLMAHYGKFSGVSNYISLVGKKSPDLDEKIGYYGERIVLKAQMLGLNTCWVALTFSKRKCADQINRGEKRVCVISLGYGSTQGTAHKSKPMEQLYRADGELPAWFRSGMEAAILAPTAINQQKFLFSLNGNTVCAKATGGVYSKVDLGIVKYHFEIGAGTEHFHWA